LTLDEDLGFLRGYSFVNGASRGFGVPASPTSFDDWFPHSRQQTHVCVGPMKFSGERETDEHNYYAYAQWDMLVVLLPEIMGSVQVQTQPI
jgi:hypothetical protein